MCWDESANWLKNMMLYNQMKEKIVHKQLAHCGAKANPDNGNNPLAPSDVVFSKDKSSQHT